ncbi:MAG TPA: hypothetical protein VL120_02515, partial [Solirubrobacteraceae bacterium]|nr:hypothetical protein [Solirubrobacteraceae bacterium]
MSSLPPPTPAAGATALTAPATALPRTDALDRRARSGAASRLRALAAGRPELFALLAAAAVLYLWALGRNGMANEYYAAAVKSMSTSWHAFLFGS